MFNLRYKLYLIILVLISSSHHYSNRVQLVSTRFEYVFDALTQFVRLMYVFAEKIPPSYMPYFFNTDLYLSVYSVVRKL